MPLGLPKSKNFGIKKSDKVKTSFTKTDVERSLRMSNLGKKPKNIDKKVDDIDDVFDPKV
jgi:hypothetical protein